jgi:hypothetical protein
MTPQRKKRIKFGIFIFVCLAHLIVVYWHAESVWSLWLLPFLLGMYYILYWMLRLARDD